MTPLGVWKSGYIGRQRMAGRLGAQASAYTCTCANTYKHTSLLQYTCMHACAHRVHHTALYCSHIPHVRALLYSTQTSMPCTPHSPPTHTHPSVLLKPPWAIV